MLNSSIEVSQAIQNLTPTTVAAKTHDGSLSASQLSINTVDMHLTNAKPSLELSPHFSQQHSSLSIGSNLNNLSLCTVHPVTYFS